MNDDRNDKLERFVAQALGNVPARRAPRSLEQRVLAELGRRSAMPWWRKSFAYWPAPARVAFIVVCTVIVGSALMGELWVMAGFDVVQFKAAFTPHLAWLEAVLVVTRALGDSFSLVVRNIPSLWLYGGLLFIAGLYATLFGLGAAAFKAVRGRFAAGFDAEASRAGAA